MQKILQIAPTPFFADRGCHIRIEGIVRCLSELEFENLVCTYHHGRDVEGVATRRIKAIRNYTQTAAGPSKYKLLADWRLLWLGVKHYRASRPVAIHAHLHEGLLIGLIIKLLFFWRKTPLIGDMQGSLTGELDSHGSFDRLPFLRWPTRLLERILMASATHIVCSSRHSLEKIQSEFSVPSDKISLVQDGADSITPLSRQRRDQLVQQHCLPGGRKIVVYSGALLDSKGLAELKQLLLSCAPDSDRLHFLVIGYPTENLQPFLQTHDLQEMVTLTGQIPFEQLPDYLSLADIAIDPKNSEAGEGSGKMLNYLAAGLPVVAYRTANNLEFLDGSTLLATNDDELYKALISLLDQPTMAEQVSAQNLGRFEQAYSWQVTRAQLKRVYEIL